MRGCPNNNEVITKKHGNEVLICYWLCFSYLEVNLMDADSREHVIRKKNSLTTLTRHDVSLLTWNTHTHEGVQY